MPFNVSRSATFYDIDVLKYPQLNLVVKSAVLDANFVTQNTGIDQRTVVPAGTILAVSATNPRTVVPFTGTGTIFGILAHSTDIIATTNLTGAAEAVPVLAPNVIFATAKIVNFSAYASILATAPVFKNSFFE